MQCNVILIFQCLLDTTSNIGLLDVCVTALLVTWADGSYFPINPVGLILMTGQE